ncbi:MAG: PIN domain-containing protein, partial [Actinomycetota bacterium]|nr:PIN domain-containing protein [Actinomycetota bacterium]
ASPHGPRCVAAEAVAIEISRHLPRLAEQRGLDQTLLFAALAIMPIEWTAVGEYNDQREEAEARTVHRDPDDWPTVALALKLSIPSGHKTRTSTTPAYKCSPRASSSTHYGTPATSSSTRPRTGPLGSRTGTACGRSSVTRVVVPCTWSRERR